MADNRLKLLRVAMENRLKLLAISKQCLGRDMAYYNDEFGCAEALNSVVKKALGREIGGGASTYYLYQAIKTDLRFERVSLPLPGDLILSATGYGDRKKLRNGHVGIVHEQEKIASNTSANGLWEENYTLTAWKRRWKDYGRYPMDYFRVITPSEVPPSEVPQPIPQPIVIPAQTLLPQWLRFLLDRQALGALRSPKWSKLQKITVTNHPYCAFHGGKGTFLNPLNVHHVKMFMEHPELELDPNNLLVACRFCHFWYCHKGNWKKLNSHSKEDSTLLLSHIEQS